MIDSNKLKTLWSVTKRKVRTKTANFNQNMAVGAEQQQQEQQEKEQDGTNNNKLKSPMDTRWDVRNTLPRLTLPPSPLLPSEIKYSAVLVRGQAFVHLVVGALLFIIGVLGSRKGGSSTLSCNSGIWCGMAGIICGICGLLAHRLWYKNWSIKSFLISSLLTIALCALGLAMTIYYVMEDSYQTATNAHYSSYYHPSFKEKQWNSTNVKDIYFDRPPPPPSKALIGNLILSLIVEIMVCIWSLVVSWKGVRAEEFTSGRREELVKDIVSKAPKSTTTYETETNASMPLAAICHLLQAHPELAKSKTNFNLDFNRPASQHSMDYQERVSRYLSNAEHPDAISDRNSTPTSITSLTNRQRLSAPIPEDKEVGSSKSKINDGDLSKSRISLSGTISPTITEDSTTTSPHSDSTSPVESPPTSPEVPLSSTDCNSTSIESNDDSKSDNSSIRQMQSLVLGNKRFSPLSKHVINPSEMMPGKRVAPQKTHAIKSRKNRRAPTKGKAPSVISEDSEFSVHFTNSEHLKTLPPPLPKKEFSLPRLVLDKKKSSDSNYSNSSEEVITKITDVGSDYEIIENTDLPKKLSVSSGSSYASTKKSSVIPEVHSSNHNVAKTMPRKKKDRRPPPPPPPPKISNTNKENEVKFTSQILEIKNFEGENSNLEIEYPNLETISKSNVVDNPRLETDDDNRVMKTDDVDNHVMKTDDVDNHVMKTDDVDNHVMKTDDITDGNQQYYENIEIVNKYSPDKCTGKNSEEANSEISTKSLENENYKDNETIKCIDADPKLNSHKVESIITLKNENQIDRRNSVPLVNCIPLQNSNSSENSQINDIKSTYKKSHSVDDSMIQNGNEGIDRGSSMHDSVKSELDNFFQSKQYKSKSEVKTPKKDSLQLVYDSSKFNDIRIKFNNKEFENTHENVSDTEKPTESSNIYENFTDLKIVDLKLKYKNNCDIEGKEGESEPVSESDGEIYAFQAVNKELLEKNKLIKNLLNGGDKKSTENIDKEMLNQKKIVTSSLNNFQMHNENNAPELKEVEGVVKTNSDNVKYSTKTEPIFRNLPNKMVETETTGSGKKNKITKSFFTEGTYVARSDFIKTPNTYLSNSNGNISTSIPQNNPLILHMNNGTHSSVNNIKLPTENSNGYSSKNSKVNSISEHIYVTPYLKSIIPDSKTIKTKTTDTKPVTTNIDGNNLLKSLESTYVARSDLVYIEQPPMRQPRRQPLSIEIRPYSDKNIVIERNPYII